MVQKSSSYSLLGKDANKSNNSLSLALMGIIVLLLLSSFSVSTLDQDDQAIRSLNRSLFQFCALFFPKRLIFQKRRNFSLVLTSSSHEVSLRLILSFDQKC